MFRAVIDKQGFYVEFVEIDNMGNPIGYILKDGETLISDLSFQGMIRPRYINNKWVETGTPPTPTPIEKTEDQIKIGKLGQENTDLEIQNIVQGQKITDLEIQNTVLGQTVTELELKILNISGGNTNANIK